MLGLLLAAVVHAAETVNIVVTVVQTNSAPTNAAPPLPHPLTATTLSMQMRLAAQMARGKAAPWTQRFIVTAVEEKPLTRNEDDEPPVFSTNYLVTVVPVTGETNAPITWGMAKNKSIRFVTTSHTKRGDEFELFPVKLPLLPQ